jgi:hypothetical protein
MEIPVPPFTHLTLGVDSAPCAKRRSKLRNQDLPLAFCRGSRKLDNSTHRHRHPEQRPAWEGLRTSVDRRRGLGDPLGSEADLASHLMELVERQTLLMGERRQVRVARTRGESKDLADFVFLVFALVSHLSSFYDAGTMFASSTSA